MNSLTLEQQNWLKLHSINLISTEYRLGGGQRHLYVSFKCSCGEKVTRLPAQLVKRFPGCSKCARQDAHRRNSRLSEVLVRLDQSKAVFNRLETDGKNSHVHFSCNCGNPVRRRINQVLEYAIADCESCRIARLPRGVEAPGFKIGLTQEQRDGRKRGGLQGSWARKCLRRDNFTCQITGIVEKKLLCVHHLYSFALYPQYRYVPENGITILRTLHKEFHSLYPGSSFTPQDFAQFYMSKTGRSFELPTLDQ